MSVKNLFKTEGILRKNNFADLSEKIPSATNLLSAAFAGGDYIYDDIAIINDISNYGTLDVTFEGLREFGRLDGIQIEDIEKVQIDGEFPKARPIQTINDQLEKIKVEIGEGFKTGGGDGLYATYYNWNDVYGEVANDLLSTGGGTYVENQSSSDYRFGFVGNAYFSPNTAVAPSDSEAFYEFSEDDLSNAKSVIQEVVWDLGVFNWSETFHPSMTNQAGIVKLNGYFNGGFSTNSETKTISAHDRIVLVQQHVESTLQYTSTSIPTIIKIWDVDQKTGLKTTSDNSPIRIARYSSGLNSPTPSKPDNSPIYEFSTFEGGGINDNLISQSDGVNDPRYIGPSYFVQPISDSSPGNPNRNRFSQPFKQDHFYYIEIYFILSPRALQSLEHKSAFITGYEQRHNRMQVLRKNSLYSDNPLNKKRGKLNIILDQTMKNCGTKISGSATRIGYDSPLYGKHLESVGLSISENYGRILTPGSISIGYKPPRIWKDIVKPRWETGCFNSQAESPHRYHYVAYGIEYYKRKSFKTDDGINFGLTDGNLLIDYDSPKPVPSFKSGGGVFDSFTYVDQQPAHSDYFNLSKNVTGIKTKKSYRTGKVTTTIQAIEHKGIKGYGVGKIDLVAGKGFGGGTGMELSCGLRDSQNNRVFYEGERLSKGDIIIFEKYDDTPFVQVSDSSPLGVYVTLLSSKSAKPGLTSTNLGSNDSELQSKFVRPLNNTPEGRNFFVYRHRGLVNSSLDSFCSLYKTGTPTIEAKVDEDTATGSVSVKIQRNDLTSYDGKLYRKAYTINEETTGGTSLGILGMHADYNGNAVPNGTLINKVLDHSLPYKINISDADDTSMRGEYVLDQYGVSIRSDVTEGGSLSPSYYRDKSIFGEPITGDFFYRKSGSSDSPKRLVWRESVSKWALIDGNSPASVKAEWNSGNKYYPPNAGPAAYGDEDATIDSYTSRNSPTAPYELFFTNVNDSDSNYNNYTPQPLTQDLNIGFGITICDSPSRAQVRYQCFPPTNTAPPFRATNTGLRSIPEGEAGDGSDSIGSIEVSYSSPGAGSGVSANAPVTSITFNSLHLHGSYGDNSPGVNTIPTGSLLHDGSGNFFQPGGVMLLDTESDYEKTIDFEFITINGDIQKYQLLCSTSSTV